MVRVLASGAVGGVMVRVLAFGAVGGVMVRVLASGAVDPGFPLPSVV
jgi:MOSC domain-containing protein YiiM